MEFNADAYRKWIGTKVVVAVNVGSGSTAQCVELEGDLKAVHERGIMIRPKGRISHEMIAAEQLERFELLDNRPKPIKPKRMPHVAFGSIRQHLADRHGFALEELNGSDFTENRAYDVHLSEHEPHADMMSHFHEG